MSYINKTDIKIDFPKLKQAYEDLIEKVGEVPGGQISLTHRPGCTDKLTDNAGSLYDFEKGEWLAKERDFSEFNEDFKSTYFYQIYNMMPRPIGRMRVMHLPPHHCMSMHIDFETRWHIAIITNPRAYLFFANGEFYRIPTNGYVYEMDARPMHTAFNSGSEMRVHLMMSDAGFTSYGVKEG